MPRHVFSPLHSFHFMRHLRSVPLRHFLRADTPPPCRFISPMLLGTPVLFI